METLTSLIQPFIRNTCKTEASEAAWTFLPRILKASESICKLKAKADPRVLQCAKSTSSRALEQRVVVISRLGSKANARHQTLTKKNLGCKPRSAMVFRMNLCGRWDLFRQRALSRTHTLAQRAPDSNLHLRSRGAWNQNQVL